MKQIKSFAVAFTAILLLLTSCLGDDGGNSGTLRQVFVKARYANMRTFLDAPNGDVYYSDRVIDLTPGDWYLIDFSYDMNSPENLNAAENGFIVVNLLANPEPISKGIVNREGSDLEKPIDGEFPLIDGLTGFGYMLNDLFISSKFKALTDQRSQFFMIFDYSQEPEVEQGQSVYNVYIRAKVTLEGKSPSGEANLLTYYNVEHIMEVINQQEKNKGNDSFYLKVNYVSEINEETGELKWESSRTEQPIAVKKDS